MPDRLSHARPRKLALLLSLGALAAVMSCAGCGSTPRDAYLRSRSIVLSADADPPAALGVISPISRADTP